AGENPRALQREIDAELLPGQRRRILDRRHLDAPVADADGIARNLHLSGETAVHRVKAQEMRVRLHRSEVVEGDDINVVAIGFGDRAQYVAPDAAEPIDGDTN